ALRGVKIYFPNSDHVGLFGYVKDGGRIINLNMQNATVAGRVWVGGFFSFFAGGSCDEFSETFFLFLSYVIIIVLFSGI
ncbi:MAG TPA: hypothetical protein PK467_12015, partial [Candidatus Wallbacteria bacterium]|nr:hypothetical protein [Candidatus Wallbacteria bacterium]